MIRPAVDKAIHELLKGSSIVEAVDTLLESSYRRDYNRLKRKHGEPYGEDALSPEAAREFMALKKKHGVRGATRKRKWGRITKSRLGITYSDKHF
jgi:hypothetical protein